MLRLIRVDVNQGLAGDRWNVFGRGCSRSGQFKVGSSSDWDRNVKFMMTVFFFFFQIHRGYSLQSGLSAIAIVAAHLSEIISTSISRLGPLKEDMTVVYNFQSP